MALIPTSLLPLNLDTLNSPQFTTLTTLAILSRSSALFPLYYYLLIRIFYNFPGNWHFINLTYQPAPIFTLSILYTFIPHPLNFFPVLQIILDSFGQILFLLTNLTTLSYNIIR